MGVMAGDAGVGGGGGGSGTAVGNNNDDDDDDDGDSEERRRRRALVAVLDVLRTRPGRVSEEALEALAKQTEFECLWEEGGPDGARTLSMGGSGVVIEVRRETFVLLLSCFFFFPQFFPACMWT
jgi:hypothetical protein